MPYPIKDLARGRGASALTIKAAASPPPPQAGATLDLLSEPGAVTIEAAADDGNGRPKLPSFKMTVYTGGPMTLACWYRPVIVDLAGLRIPSQSRPVRFNHNAADGVGHTDRLAVENNKLLATGLISRDTEAAREIVASSKLGFPWRASIGAQIQEYEFVKEGQTVEVNGRKFRGPVYVARKSTLGEISFVDLGADEKSSARVAAKAPPPADARGDTDMGFNAWVRAKGLDPDTLDEAKLAELKAEYAAEQAADSPQDNPPAAPVQGAAAPAPQPGNDPPADPILQMRAAAAAELERITAVQAAAGDGHPEIAAKAVAEGWDANRTELEVLRAQRPQAPAVLVARGPSGPQVLEAALCLAQHVGGSDEQLLASYGEQVINDADKFRRIGLRKTAELAAAMAGVDLPLSVDTEWVQAAFSTTSLSGIVGAVANKALAKGFSAPRAVVPRIAATRNHGNFHTHTVYSLAISGDLEPVAPTGELKHLSLSEESWTRQVTTRGAVLSISRQDIINDELGAFTQNATALGRKSSIARERAMALLFIATGAGSSHFTSARGNYFEGAATNLQLTSLGTGVQMFRDQTGPDGDPVSIEPRILLVPTALEETGKVLMDRSARMIATALGSTAASKREPNANVWAGDFEPIVWEWLSRTISGTAGSSTAWWLLAGPGDVPACEIAYLNGLEEPTVEYFGLDQVVSTLGVSWRCFWDFGVALAEYRAGVKSKGAA